MSLEVIDFTERNKKYKLEAGVFTLKPPYIYVVNQAETLIKEVDDIRVKLKAKNYPQPREMVADASIPIYVDTAENNSVTNVDVDTDINSRISTTFKRIMDLYLNLLKLLLEETDEGKFADLTTDNLRLDVAETIIKDFFQQFRK